MKWKSWWLALCLLHVVAQACQPLIQLGMIWSGASHYVWMSLGGTVVFKCVAFAFLERKLDLDQISYSLIRVSDGDPAFELHQRLQEGEASFEELASEYSEGSEKDSQGRIGPLPRNLAHPAVVNKLRTSNEGQLWPPFFLKNIWLILRLDQWQGARLNDATREQMLEQLFDEWVDARVEQRLAGDTPSPLPLHALKSL